MFLAAGWAQNDYRIRQLALYIRDCIETKRIGIGWETYTAELRKKGRIRPFLLRGPFAKYSARGIFIGTQIITIVVAACNLSFSIQEVVLLAIDGLVIMITAILLRDWKVG